MPCARPQADPCAQLVVGQDPAVRIARRVQPDEDDPRGVGGRRVGAADGEPGQHRAHLVGRVGHLGMITVPPPCRPSRVGRSATSSLDPTVGTNDGSAPVRVGDLDPEPAVQPPGRSRAQLGRAQRGRVPGRVAGSGQRLARARRVCRRPGCRSTGRPPRRGAGRRAPAPRRGRPRGSPAATRVAAPVAGPGRQWPSPCGGRAATSGWSLPIFPVLAAPPGLPRSEKNSTLAL